jgi:hypothetical protein
LPILAAEGKVTAMVNATVNPTSQHELFLKLFITNGGGW